MLIRTAMENPSLRRVLVASLLRVAPGAFALKALVNLLNSLWSKKKSHADGSTTGTATKPQQQQQQHHPASFIARLNVPDAAKFAAFIGGLSAAAPLFERLVWRILASPILLDPQAKSASVFRRALLASIVGGGISGAALLLEDESRRPAIAHYALVNAMDVLFRSALIKKWLPLLPRVTDTRRLSYVYVVCMCFIASWTLFAHGYHYTTFFRPYQRFLAKYGNVSEVRWLRLSASRLEATIHTWHPQSRRSTLERSGWIVPSASAPTPTPTSGASDCIRASAAGCGCRPAGRAPSPTRCSSMARCTRSACCSAD